MADRYVEILIAAGGKMEFSAFIDACRQSGVDARLWLRAKHEGKLISWINESGGHFIGVPGSNG